MTSSIPHTPTKELCIYTLGKQYIQEHVTCIMHVGQCHPHTVLLNSQYMQDSVTTGSFTPDRTAVSATPPHLLLPSNMLVQGTDGEIACRLLPLRTPDLELWPVEVLQTTGVQVSWEPWRVEVAGWERVLHHVAVEPGEALCTRGVFRVVVFVI